VFVAASTACFPELSLAAALERLSDLEFTNVELLFHEEGGNLKPSQIAGDMEHAVRLCRETHRLTPIAYSFDTTLSDENEEYYRHFAACCGLARATKVVTMTVRAGVLGTPFNAEIERLRRLVSIAAAESVVVGLLTETGRMTQDPDTAIVLCDNVRGLALTLDPSYYIWGPHGGSSYESVMKFTCHVRLRDTTKEKFQVRVGQGQVEYNYNRAL
jgi:sugar phosphate isomerase/epimerase